MTHAYGVRFLPYTPYSLTASLVSKDEYGREDESRGHGQLAFDPSISTSNRASEPVRGILCSNEAQTKFMMSVDEANPGAAFYGDVVLCHCRGVSESFRLTDSFVQHSEEHGLWSNRNVGHGASGERGLVSVVTVIISFRSICCALRCLDAIVFDESSHLHSLPLSSPSA